jgi:hypothetical protein
VYLDYAGDIAEAVTSLINGNELSEAIRIVSSTPKDGPLWLRCSLNATGKEKQSDGFD